MVLPSIPVGGVITQNLPLAGDFLPTAVSTTAGPIRFPARRLFLGSVELGATREDM